MSNEQTTQDILNAAAAATLQRLSGSAAGRQQLASMSGHDREVLEAAASECRERVARQNR